VMDTYAAHKRGEIRTWLAANPKIQVHFTEAPPEAWRHRL
jgi:hypothetical protein